MERINVKQDFDLRYWAREFGVEVKALTGAVKVVGTSADKVRDHLMANGTSGAGPQAGAGLQGSPDRPAATRLRTEQSG